MPAEFSGKTLTQNWQTQARPQLEWESGHFLKRRMKLRVAARLKGDDERERVFVEAGILQNGVDVELVSR